MTKPHFPSPTVSRARRSPLIDRHALVARPDTLTDGEKAALFDYLAQPAVDGQWYYRLADLIFHHRRQPSLAAAAQAAFRAAIIADAAFLQDAPTDAPTAAPREQEPL